MKLLVRSSVCVSLESCPPGSRVGVTIDASVTLEALLVDASERCRAAETVVDSPGSIRFAL